MAAGFMSAPRDHGSPGSRAAVNGALWPHHRNTLGWWPRRSTIARGWRAAWRRTPRVAPLEREVLPHEDAHFVGRVVELGIASVRAHVRSRGSLLRRTRSLRISAVVAAARAYESVRGSRL